VTLERNYRSTEPILAVANAVSAQEQQAYERRLWTNREGGAAPELAWPLDEGEQARMVCERVLAAREQGMELRAQAVLFRAGHDSDLLELELTRRASPFVKYGGLRYLEAAHVKDLLAALRLVSNPADEVSWMRLLQLIDGVGPVRARRIVETLRPPQQQAPALERWPLAARELPSAAREQAGALIGVLANTASVSCGELVEAVCAAVEPLARVRYPDWHARGPDYERLASAARGASDVRRFVSELVLDPPSSSADLAGPPHLDEDYLTLSTVHSAKGLEWDAVHVIAVYDGNFPADMSAGSAAGIAEERRLLYVALTRARRRLHVYVPTRYYHRPDGRGDAHGYGLASRFLTPEVQAGFEHTGQSQQQGGPEGDAQRPVGRIEVSLDALFP
jgi:DNA helicase-2/ATP-dependent DNA helicase PcrA